MELFADSRKTKRRKKLTNSNDDDKKGSSPFRTKPLSELRPSPSDQLGRAVWPARPPSGYAANLPERKTVHVPVISTFSMSVQTAPVTMKRAPWEKLS
jgi:hypothetical protein